MTGSPLPALTAAHDPNLCIAHDCPDYREMLATMDAALNRSYEAENLIEALKADVTYYKRKADDMQQAYELKIQDFAKETLRNSDLLTAISEHQTHCPEWRETEVNL